MLTESLLGLRLVLFCISTKYVRAYAQSYEYNRLGVELRNRLRLGECEGL